MLFYIVYLTILHNYVYSADLNNHKGDFTVLYEWSHMEYDYSTNYERQLDIQNGNYVPEKSTPIDTDVYYSREGYNKVFVTIPKLDTGIPVTLGTITPKTVNHNPVITPYPSWNWHKEPEKCRQDRIVSVFRITIDECDRLWILDTGVLVDKMICPPQILIFDLRTDILIHRYEIPSNQIDCNSLLVTPAIEVLKKHHQCQETFAYLADCQSNSIIVYDLQKDISWKVNDKTMYPHPEFGSFTIQGESFELMDGVLGMTLSPPKDGQRKLYFHSMSSPTEHWVYTSYLQNQSMFSVSTPPEIFNTLNGRRQTQVAAEAMDSKGIMYFGLVNDVQIACYNTKAGDYGSWKSSDIIADNPVTLQFTSGIKVVKNKLREEELWILTNRFQKVATGSLNPNEINFRIQAARVSDLIHGTQCVSGNNFQQISSHFGHAGGYGHYKN